MRKFLFYLITALLLFVAVALVYNPERYIKCCLEGITVWAITVLPSLLPFFFLTLLLTNLGIATRLAKICESITKRLYGCGGEGAFVQIMSFISGYPVGAKLIAELYNEGVIESQEATKISLFTSTSGPMFVLGSVGIGMFLDRRVGFFLLCSHFFSAILNGIAFKRLYKEKNFSPLKLKRYSGNLLYDCAYSATLSCLIVGCFIAVFYVFCQILLDSNLLYPFVFIFSLLFKDIKKAQGFCVGLIELTNGCILLARDWNDLSVCLTAFLISFGGLSILIQSITFLKQARVNIKLFILSKLMQAITSFLICFLMCKFL